MISVGDRRLRAAGLDGDGQLVWEDDHEDLVVAHLSVKKWIAAMLNDTTRNAAYQKALQRASGVVLDVGSGTGLLAMLAASADHVVAVEMDAAMCTLLRQHVGSRVTVVEAHSTKIQDLPIKAKVIVSELLDHTLLGEGWLPSTRDALRLAANDVTLVPSRARVFCVLLGSRRPLDLVLSDEVEALVIDPRLPNTSRKVELVALEQGTVTALGFWWTAELCEGVEISSRQWQDHWRPWAQPIKPFSVVRGSRVSFVVAHDDLAVTADLPGDDIRQSRWVPPPATSVLDVSDGSRRGLKVVAAANASTVVCVCDALHALKIKDRVLAVRWVPTVEDLKGLDVPRFDLVCAEPDFHELNPILTLLRLWTRYSAAKSVLRETVRYSPRFAHIRFSAYSSSRIRSAYAPLPSTIQGCQHGAARDAWNAARARHLFCLDLVHYRDDLVHLVSTVLHRIDLAEPLTFGREELLECPRGADIVGLAVDYFEEDDDPALFRDDDETESPILARFVDCLDARSSFRVRIDRSGQCRISLEAVYNGT